MKELAEFEMKYWKADRAGNRAGVGRADGGRRCHVSA